MKKKKNTVDKDEKQMIDNRPDPIRTHWNREPKVRFGRAGDVIVNNEIKVEYFGTEFIGPNTMKLEFKTSGFINKPLNADKCNEVAKFIQDKINES